MQLQKLKLQNHMARLHVVTVKINEIQRTQVIDRNDNLIYQVGDLYFQSSNVGKKL